MSNDANQVELDSNTQTVEAPDAQPVQASETPAVTEQVKQDPAPHGQGAQQTPDTVPYWRVKELADQNRELKERLRMASQPPQNTQASSPQTQPPKQEDFQTYEDYVEARAEFKAKETVRKEWENIQEGQRRQTQAQAEHARSQTVESNWSQKATEASNKYQDFERKLSTAPSLTNAHALAVLKGSPMAGDLAYHLASNHDIVMRLNGMHPIDAAAELGRIEGKLQGQSSQPQKKPAAGIPALEPVKGANNSARSGDTLTQNDVISRLYPTST
jgi:hypothetical protein